MRAAVFYGANQPLKVEEVPKPQIGAGEILVKVAACGLCHTDLHYLDHGVPTFKKPPLILGHEVSGTVAEVAAGVSQFQVGDRVLLPAVMACGVCDNCRAGRGNICRHMVMLGNDVDGGYAEYIKAEASNVFHLPAEIPLIEGAIIADAITTPFHAVKNRGKVKPGDTVIVYGCGGVGLNLVQVANAAGASVIAVDMMEVKLNKAKELGAVATVNAGEVPDVAKAIRKLTGGGAEIAFECIGNPKTMESAFSSVRNGGRLVIVGYTEHTMTLNASRVMYREMEVIGSLGCPLTEYPKVIELVRTGKLQVETMVSRRFSLDQINEGLDFVRSGQGFRSVVVP
ncbi:Alcohol dehydrogenase GroES-like domain protein [Acididesulfobacillus acetoxydans]|uniref:Alcohol dehydrogenase n=1 Tax=Acididesulfobacillus acetoxydans TaxID=1561005 RepID=A0A8S0W7T9_9FIRM|nr:zinc-binding dehydrogenase [Acididesulfobacillus acetoxydans]CAA7601119.1 Alcohol dehydrogenase GroES-like domain protein [Acididesulfobacillus acetoxydans]CEJ08602.1 Alcohol dehydrogenase [Acididesulfobacillus acetoxydans]